jgi:hypothetical protein
MPDLDGLEYASYFDFSGGENVDVDPDNLDDNECECIENIDPAIKGGFSTRLGCTALNEVSYGAQVEQIFEWLKPDGTTELLAMIGDDLCTVDPTDGTATLIQDMGGAGKLANFPFQDKIYIIDRFAGAYYTYDGTTLAAVTPAAGADLTFLKGCKFAVFHDKSFRWLFGGNSSDKIGLMYSEPLEPNNVKPASVLYPTRAMGEMTGLQDFAGNIISFYKYGARIWRGIDPDQDVEWARIPIPEGTPNNYAATLTPETLTYLGSSGLWSLSPAILNYNFTMQTSNSLVPNLAFMKQTKNIRAITRPDLACSIYDPISGFFMLAYTKTVGESRNSRVMVHRWGTRSFWHYTGWQVNDWCLLANGNLLFAGNGHIYKARTGTNDAGAAISQRLHSKKIGTRLKNNYKTLGKVMFDSGQRPEVSTVDVKIKSESSSITRTEIPLKVNPRWSGRWSGRWGASEMQTTEINPDPALTGLRFQLIYTNDRLDEVITIYGHRFGYIPSAPIGGRV